jgi:sporulation protein YlmC with PRC-barrel domain
VIGPVINPNNFKIEGFYCEDLFNKESLILLWQDVRDMNARGYIVNDHEVLVEPHELVRLKDVLETNFNVINKPVETISNEKVGKVNDYAVETKSMYIQKIYVSQSILKSFTGGNLSVDRNQIHEVTNTKIIINDLTKKAPMTAAAAAPNF